MPAATPNAYWLENFRGIPHLDARFKTPVTVLVGVNGSGKSSLLEAIALLLSPMADHFLGPEKPSELFVQDDVSNDRTTAKAGLSAVMGQEISWSVTIERRGSGFPTAFWNKADLDAALEQIDGRLAQAPEIPIVVYYPTDRAVLDIPLRIRTRHDFNQFAAWEGALGQGETRFRLFFEWYRDREDIENEERARGASTKDSELEAVRSAILALLPGYSDLKIQRQNLRMTIQKPDGTEVSVGQLSAGEKGLLALVGDLARRLTIAGAGAPPSSVRGVVLIDEIELHLHPKWQREVIPALQRAFPKCQFIITTHSPQVISQVDRAGVLILNRTQQGLDLVPATSSRGKDTNALLREIFAERERPDFMVKKIGQLREFIDQDMFVEARDLLDEIREDLGENDPSVMALEWDLKDSEP